MAGSEAGTTIDDNTRAYGELDLVSSAVGAAGRRDLSTSVLGQALSMPVMISPTGVQAVHPDGEVAVARAAAAREITTAVSCFAVKPVEQVCAAGAATLSQLHWIGTRDQLVGQLDRARRAGAAGVILTLDWSFSEGRDWGSPIIPERVDLATVMRFAPQCLARPRWLGRFVAARSLPTLRTPNLPAPQGGPHTFFGAYGQWMGTPLPSWEDVAWLREQWGGPFMLKGVMRVDDAHRAVQAGVTAISVSNHGGNNLDGTPAPIRALPAVAKAVGHEVEIVTDGGIRRGSDVVKAVSLGARAVMIGRAYLWGLAANGQAGVENVLDILRSGIDSAVLGLGERSVHDLGPRNVVVPPDFPRVLGTKDSDDPVSEHV